MKRRQLPSMKVLTEMLNDLEKETQKKEVNKSLLSEAQPGAVDPDKRAQDHPNLSKRDQDIPLTASTPEETVPTDFPLNLGTDNKILLDAYWKALRDYYKTL